MKSGNISLLFRKSAIFRVVSYLFFIGIAVFAISFISIKTKKIPIIESINPPVGSAGDMLVIKGINFGSTRGLGYVEIGGSRITASGYTSWTDSQIKLVLPSNVQDGLVFVTTQSGKSEPGFFVNAPSLPVPAQTDKKILLPVISSTKDKAVFGETITIAGNNFGSVRGKNQVLFTANRDDANEEKKFIAVKNEGYAYWSENEIHVIVPDGAKSGVVCVKTDEGTSNGYSIEISSPVGTKSFTARKKYVVQLIEDVECNEPKNLTTVTMRVPRPQTSAQQPFVELADYMPDPVIFNYKNTIVNQVDLTKINQGKKILLNQIYRVGTYKVSTQIAPKNVQPYSEETKKFYSTALQADKIIKSDSEQIIDFAKKIVQNETNIYNQARKLYDYIVSYYTLSEKLRENTAAPEELVKISHGDAYDFAIFYTELLRSLGIIANPVSGIIVNSDKSSKIHWWTEFYIENFGWVPVDVAMGLGRELKAFDRISDSKNYYFGNLDNQHIIFSIGWNEMKSMSQEKSKVTRMQKTFALQSVWEESSDENVNYTSHWSNPVVSEIN